VNEDQMKRIASEIRLPPHLNGRKRGKSAGGYLIEHYLAGSQKVKHVEKGKIIRNGQCGSILHENGQQQNRGFEASLRKKTEHARRGSNFATISEVFCSERVNEAEKGSSKEKKAPDWSASKYAARMRTQYCGGRGKSAVEGIRQLE